MSLTLNNFLPRLTRVAFLAVCVIVATGWFAHAAGVDERRSALVIGNSAYTALPALPNAVNDVDRIADVLRDANFEVTIGENLDKKGLEKTVREFLQTLNDGDVALFYYSGHAVQVAGENFIIPVDATLQSAYDLEVQTYNITSLLDYMRAASALQILVLDACRDNPFKGQKYYLGDKKVDAADKGLASLTPRQGSLIVYSTAPNEVAYDGSGEVSPFAGAFAEHALSPNREVRDILTSIRSEVIEKTGGRQVPWDVSSLTSQFYFVTEQKLLVLGQSVTEVRVSSRTTRVPLDIEPPIASAGMKLTARFGKVPASGMLLLDDRTLTANAPFDAARIGEVVYVSDPGNKSTELLPYSIDSDSGQTASGAVAILFDPSLPAEPEKPLVVAQADDAGSIAKTVVPVSLKVTSDVGTGFAPVPTLELGAGRPTGYLRLEARAASTQVAVGDKLLVLGDIVRAEDLADLRVRPAIHDRPEEARIVLAPVAQSPDAKAVVIAVDAEVNQCDTRAAEPLDIQAVTEGVFPNDIDADAALAACRQAVEDFPDVPRFAFQLGRVHFARGEFEAALRNIRKAVDGGHVRAGQFLGRLYQLGAAVELAPEKAIPLFEAAADRGDPYAQYSLGRALMDGRGVKTDLKRGIELLNRAVESGHTYALNQLGAEYLYGRRIAKDVERAHVMFEDSAARGDVWGEVNLALLYRDGVVVQKDPERAYKLFEDAHRKLHPYAARLMALMDRQAGKDLGGVVDLFRQSADRGDAWSAVNAAAILVDNPALAKSPDEAMRLYGIAAARDAGEPSDEALAALRRYPPESVAVEVQKSLNRLGADVAVDGRIGPKARQAASAIIGKQAPTDVVALFVELARHEWIDTTPRLDML
jgi:TPR repeat protein